MKTHDETATTKNQIWGQLGLIAFLTAALIMRYLVTGQWIHPESGM